MEPASTVFWQAVRGLQPSLYKGFNPWDVVTSAAALTDLLGSAGIAGSDAQELDAQELPAQHAIARPEDFWDIILGSGYRATVDALSDTEQATLRTQVLDALRARQIKSLRTYVVFATATRATPS